MLKSMHISLCLQGYRFTCTIQIIKKSHKNCEICNRFIIKNCETVNKAYAIDSLLKTVITKLET